MTTLQSYKGLSVLPESPAPAPGGEAISNNFRELVDWGPKSAWQQTADPQGSDDVDQDFQPGSFWQNTDDPTTRLFVCRDAGTAGQDTAQWDQVIVESVETGAVVIGTDHMNSAPSDPKLAVHAESSDSDTLLVTNGGAECRTAGIHFKSATHGSGTTFSSGRIVSNFATNGCTTNPGFPGACLTLQSATGDNNFTDVLTVRNGRVGIGTTNPTNALTAVSNVASGGGAYVASLQADDGSRSQGFFVSCSTAGPAYLTTFHSSGTGRQTSGRCAFRSSTIADFAEEWGRYRFLPLPRRPRMSSRLIVSCVWLMLLFGAGVTRADDAAPQSHPSSQEQPPPVRLIFDTDMDTDCDDAGALAVLHALADRGEAEILATCVSSRYRWSVPCVEAINAYYGRRELPIGSPKGDGAGTERGSRYARQIAEEYETRLKSNDDAPDAVSVYRRMLADQPDQSVVVVTVGYLTNLRDLLASGPDEYSELSGSELVRKKVRQLVCMGGRYPAHRDPRVYGNFKPDPASAVTVARDWPTSIVFSGLGEEILTGRSLRQTPKNNPVRRAYELYLGEKPTRPSWDLIAVLYAVRPDAPYWSLRTDGRNHIFPNGTNEWREAPDDSRHRLLLLRDGSQDAVRKTLEQLMAEAPGTAALDRRPNILILVADDLGWADVGYHGSPIPTPHLDRLTREGVELDQHYVAPVCTPPRAALLSGRYWSRFGNTAPSNTQVFPFGTVTLAAALQSVGYETSLCGKWHLGSAPECGPLKFGFEHAYGSLAGGVGPWNHRYKRGPLSQTWHRRHEWIEEEGHVTDLLTAEAISRIEASRDHPFFLYVAFTAVHHPLDEPEQWLEAGRKADPKRPQYAAATMHLDDAVGQLVAALERTGQRKDTLVVFFSDNGGTIAAADADNARYPGEYPRDEKLGRNAPLRGRKTQVYEAGIRTPAFAHWPGRLAPRRVTAPLHVVDWMPTLCPLAGYFPQTDLQWDGKNIWPLLNGDAAEVTSRVLYWQGPRGRSAALREGDWKLVAHPGRSGERMELFHLADDPQEKHDLAKSEPDRVAHLQQLLQRETARDEDAVVGR